MNCVPTSKPVASRPGETTGGRRREEGEQEAEEGEGRDTARGMHCFAQPALIIQLRCGRVGRPVQCGAAPGLH